MSVNIHGKQYITVAERVIEAHKEDMFTGLNTEVLSFDPVVVKATVEINGDKTYTGISAANPSKAIEKQSPYEVAETSAVGRALGFAGYGIVEGIASADEVIKAEKSDPIMIATKVFDDKPASEGQRKMIFALARQKGQDSEEAKAKIKEFFKIEHFKDLTMTQAKRAIDSLLKLPTVNSDQIQA